METQIVHMNVQRHSRILKNETAEENDTKGLKQVSSEAAACNDALKGTDKHRMAPVDPDTKR